jgi:1-acyl-sn-glycerol-3-phosphate acyltransferase
MVIARIGPMARKARPRSLRRIGRRAFDHLELSVMRGFSRLWHGWRPVGPSPLPSAGPAIVIANHPSHADPAFLLAASRRPLRFLQARECYEVPVVRWLFALFGLIPITRGRPDAGAIRLALEKLHAGEVIALFPEGEVQSTSPESLRRGKTGAALLALRSGAPVFPAWIEGGPPSRRGSLATHHSGPASGGNGASDAGDSRPCGEAGRTTAVQMK